ncbi:MAG: hypothetical protein IKL82_05065 [Clostridia bacterium]|nr:hypothetical protein [Clostridia bacterium]
MSGKETALFFLSYKGWVWGLVLNCTLTVLFSGAIITRFQTKNKTTNFSLSILEKTLSFLIISVTISGSGELLSYITGFNKNVCSAIFSILILLYSFKPLSAVTKTLKLSLPVLLIGLLFCAFLAFYKNGFKVDLTLNNHPISPFLPNVFVSALTYAGFNSACAISVLKKQNKAYNPPFKKACSLITMGLILLILSLLVAVLLLCFKGCLNAELPLVCAIKSLCLPLYIFISIVMLLNAFSLASSHLGALLKTNKITPKITTILCACGLGFIGFSRLISTVYPIIGWVGALVALWFLISNFFTK